MPLLAGDRIRTQNGRVEILFADNSTIHLDSNTLVDFQSDEVIRLLGGRVRVNISGPGGSNRRVEYRVDAPSAWVQVMIPGEYRVSVLAGERESEVELAVLRGAADLVNEDGRTSLGAGERAFARAGARPSAAYVFNSAAWDDFDRWSEGRRDTRLGVSAEYLPETVQSYATTFSTYGSWQYLPTYGHVWYPRVRPGWRPYYYGRWTTLRPWGWTWIGSDPWAWPTHHYGRWGFNAGVWFWIPGRTWSPAWVSWAYAPGYVSWCPLGWNNRAVIGFNFNLHSGYRGYRYDPWHAWTVVPHRGFGHGFVNLNVVKSTRIDVRTRNSFVVRDTSPDVRGFAVPRSSSAIRVAGTGGGTIGGNAAFRGNPGTRSRTTAGVDADPAAAFRSRRSSSAPLGGAGYPAPAREPRAVQSAPVPGGQGASRSRDGSVPRVTAPDSGSRIERRAVPRDVAPGTPPGVTAPASPSRRGVEVYRGGVPDVNSPAISNRSDVSRAVPRGDRTENPGFGDPGERRARDANDLYVPSRSYGVQPERSRSNREPAAEAPGYSPRAMPRSAPDGGGPPQGYRSRPGPERSAPAPSGPSPSSAGPSRPSGPPQGSAGGGESRSRGGGRSSGRAVPRGGRGH
jgi:hypothetical protein